MQSNKKHNSHEKLLLNKVAEFKQQKRVDQ